MPLTQSLPKCLMPINGVPLLDIWISDLKNSQIEEIHVNTHFQPEIMEDYLGRKCFRSYVFNHYEENILGTAGALYKNHEIFSGESLLVAHADNFIDTDLTEFIDFHKFKRPKNCLITMMTFRTTRPEQCGIVVIDEEGIVQEFYEKINNPPSNLANGAVYIFEPEVLNWIKDYHPVDISKDLIPKFIGKIATWENDGVHIDIGTVDALMTANNYSKKKCSVKDQWLEEYHGHPIHSFIKNYSS